MAASDHLNPHQHAEAQKKLLGKYPDTHTTSVEAAAAWERNMNTDWGDDRDYLGQADYDDYGDSDAGDAG